MGPSTQQNSANFQTINYKDDVYGRRSEKKVDGFSTRYLYDGGQVIAEYDGNNNLLRKYIYGPGIDQPVCMIEEAVSETYYYHYDGLGSVVALSDSAGDTVQTYEYSVFGQPVASDVDFPNPYMFAGRRFDIEIGLYYNRARYYNPFIGRFLQADPIGYEDGMNMYRYCINNPLNFLDPSGLCPTLDPNYYPPTSPDPCDPCSPIDPNWFIPMPLATGEFQPPDDTIDYSDIAWYAIWYYLDYMMPGFMDGLSATERTLLSNLIKCAYEVAGIQAAAGWEATGSGIFRDPTWLTGPVKGWFNDMYFVGEDITQAFQYSGEGSGINFGASGRGVFAISFSGGSAENWSGTFHSLDVNVGIVDGVGGLSGSIFWSDDFKWVGVSYGGGIGLPVGLSYDEVIYEEWP